MHEEALKTKKLLLSWELDRLKNPTHFLDVGLVNTAKSMGIFDEILEAKISETASQQLQHGHNDGKVLVPFLIIVLIMQFSPENRKIFTDLNAQDLYFVLTSTNIPEMPVYRLSTGYFLTVNFKNSTQAQRFFEILNSDVLKLSL